MIQIIKIASVIILTGFISHLPPKSTKIENKEVNKNSFALFLSYFPQSELPFKIDLEYLEAIADKNSSNTEWYKSKSALDMNMDIMKSYLPIFHQNKFSRRGGPPIVEPLARLYLDENHVAVIFNTRPFFGPRQFTSISMVTYDLNGKTINKMDKRGKVLKSDFIASHNTTETMTCKISHGGGLETTTYKNDWEYDISEHGYVGNRIISREIYEKKNTQILNGNESIASIGN